MRYLNQLPCTLKNINILIKPCRGHIVSFSNSSPSTSYLDSSLLHPVMMEIAKLCLCVTVYTKIQVMKATRIYASNALSYSNRLEKYADFSELYAKFHLMIIWYQHIIINTIMEIQLFLLSSFHINIRLKQRLFWRKRKKEAAVQDRPDRYRHL